MLELKFLLFVFGLVVCGSRGGTFLSSNLVARELVLY